jgi:hypothetical protein
MTFCLQAPLRFLAALAPAACLAGTVFTPPPGPLATKAQLAALLATVPKAAPNESVVDFEGAQIGVPVLKWEEKGAVFTLAGPLKRTPAAKPRVMFFPHLATGHKGILNAMAGDQGVPLVMTLPPPGASSVTLVLWGSTGCPAVIEAFDAKGNRVDHRSIAAVPGRKGPSEPVPFLTITLKASAIASVNLSGPRDGEFLAVDELRFVPLAVKQPDEGPYDRE